MLPCLVATHVHIPNIYIAGILTKFVVPVDREYGFHIISVTGNRYELSGTIIRGTLKTPNSQLVTPISIKLQRSDGYD
jgi:hypothetical protein